MATLIGRCLALSGPMPRPAAHRRYLQTLNEGELVERLAALSGAVKKSAPVRFRVKQKNVAAAIARAGGAV